MLDWESAEWEGLPLLDLLYYLAYLTFALDDAHEIGRCRESYRRMLDPATDSGTVRQECVARYLDGTGVAAAQLPALRVLLWLVHARSEYQRFVADVGEDPSLEALRRSLFVALWEEETRNVAD